MCKIAERCVTGWFQSFLMGISFTFSSLQDFNSSDQVRLASQCICNLLNKNKIQNYPTTIFKSFLSQKKKTKYLGKKIWLSCLGEIMMLNKQLQGQGMSITTQSQSNIIIIIMKILLHTFACLLQKMLWISPQCPWIWRLLLFAIIFLNYLLL